MKAEKEAKIMSPYYYNELPVTGMDEEVMMVLGVMLVFLGIVLVLGLAIWILRSVSLHKIAKRRGIRHAWLAWLPIGCDWVLGSISDQYQHLVQGKVTSRRKILTILSAALWVALIAYLVLVVMAEVIFINEDSYGGIILAATIFYLMSMAVGIAAMVFYHMSNFDLYRSCNPKNAVVFLVLGILFNICEPFFYFSCRKKDLGMVVPQPVTPEPAELPPVSPEF